MAGVDQVELAISLAGVNLKPITTELLAMRSFCDQLDQQVQALLASRQPPTP